MEKVVVFVDSGVDVLLIGIVDIKGKKVEELVKKVGI